MSIDSRFAAGLRWMAAARFGGQLISWVGTIYVMRLLAPQDYGLAAICSSVLSIVIMASESGIAAGIVQAERLERDQLRSVFGASLLFAFAGAVLIVALAPIFAAFFHAPEAAPLMQVSALHLILAPMGAMTDAQLRRELRFRTSALLDIAVVVPTTASTLLFALADYGVWALILGPLIGTVVRVVLLNCIAPVRFWPSFDLRPARGLIGFGFKVALSRIASYVFGQSDVLIAGRILSKSALGEYSVAMNLAMLPVSKAMTVLNQVTYPVIAQLNREGVPMQQHLLQGLRLIAYVIIPLLWGLAAVAPWLIPALLGPAWVGSVLPLQIVALALPLRLLSVLLSSAIQGMGHAGLDLQNAVTGIVLMPCCFLFGAQFGAVGLATSWLIGLPILVLLNMLRSRQVLGFGPLAALRALSRPLAFSAVMAGMAQLIGYGLATRLSVWPVIAITIVSAALGYLTLLCLLDPSGTRKLLSVLRTAVPTKEFP